MTKRIDPTQSLRGRCGRSRELGQRLLRPGKGRTGFGAWNASGDLVATHPVRKVLEDWYGDECRVGKLNDG